MTRRSLIVAIMLHAVPLFAFANNEPPLNDQDASVLKEAVSAYRKGEHSGAVKVADPLAARGHFAAQYLMGVALANADLKERNIDGAVEWLEKAAAQGFVPAMRDLGHLNLLYRPRGDAAKAGRWYEAAASRGDALSQQMVGILRLYGLGLTRDWATAYMWITLASKAGDDPENVRLSENLLKKLRTVLPTKDLAKGEAMAKDWKPAAENASADHGVLAKMAAEFQAAGAQDVNARMHMASAPQLRFGAIVGDILKMDPVFAALLYPVGGLVGLGK